MGRGFQEVGKERLAWDSPPARRRASIAASGAACLFLREKELRVPATRSSRRCRRDGVRPIPGGRRFAFRIRVPAAQRRVGPRVEAAF